MEGGGSGWIKGESKGRGGGRGEDEEGFCFSRVEGLVSCSSTRPDGDLPSAGTMQRGEGWEAKLTIMEALA